ncbi:AAA family ATPase [Tumebacillus sp. ITR2]|uniref:AAA family ATPase n=1 Tax=Tumebacillus amylolyticus TaxID=2801339 RepID=A0ABS1J5W2_9BACL|nr:P-loop NTPase fold protein [Tumebacillus amylolyticus]MBL0385673.1 AAA family ATPase [Tumebacillus amylolyticus]
MSIFFVCWGTVILGLLWLLWLTTKQVPSEGKDGKTNQEDLLHDQPIQEAWEDKLGRVPFAERLAKILKSSYEANSLVVGLYGKWGIGKTSVLNLTERYLAEDKDLILIHFNPWYFKDGEELIRQFFLHVSNEIMRKMGKETSELVKRLKQYGERLAPAIKFNLFGLDFSGADLLKGGPKDVMSLHEEIKTLLKQAKRPILVMIDDIDRLDRKDIQTLFKLVKLCADFPYTVYLLSFDEKVVADSLAEEFAVDQELGGSFLEKIIQVPLHVPQPNSIDLRDMVFVGIKNILDQYDMKLRREDEYRLFSLWDQTIGGLLTTPRIAKRYLNGLMFALPLLKGEVNLVDCLYVEATRVFLPEVYHFIRTNADIVLSFDRGVYTNDPNLLHKQKLDKILDELPSNQQKVAAESLIKNLFPQTESYKGLIRRHGSSNWELEKHVCSAMYFERYFQYSVSENDIPDVALQAYLEETLLQTDDVQRKQKFLHLARNKKGIKRLIQKLRTMETIIQPKIAEKLALTLAELGDQFSDSDGISYASTRSQAGILINYLTKRLPNEERILLMNQIMVRANLLSFAAEIFFGIREDNDDSIQKCVVASLLPRIEEAAQTPRLYDMYPQYASHLLYIWRTWGEPEEVRTALRGWFLTQEGAEKFLVSHVRFITFSETGEERVLSFGEEDYKNISEYLPPQEIADHLRPTYAARLHEVDEKLPITEQTAIRFLKYHENVLILQLAKDAIENQRPYISLDIRKEEEQVLLVLHNNGAGLAKIRFVTPRTDLEAGSFYQQLSYAKGDGLIGAKKQAKLLDFEIGPNETYTFALKMGHMFSFDDKDDWISSISVYYEDVYRNCYRSRLLYVRSVRQPKYEYRVEGRENLNISTIPTTDDVGKIYKMEFGAPVIFRPYYLELHLVEKITKMKGTILGGISFTGGRPIKVEEVNFGGDGYPTFQVQVGKCRPFRIISYEADTLRKFAIKDLEDRYDNYPYQEYGLEAEGNIDEGNRKDLYDYLVKTFLELIESK